MNENKKTPQVVRVKGRNRVEKSIIQSAIR